MLEVMSLISKLYKLCVNIKTMQQITLIPSICFRTAVLTYKGFLGVVKWMTDIRKELRIFCFVLHH